MKKKGFTLVELLASLALVTIVILLVIPSISNYNKKIRQEAYNSKIDSVLSSAKDWGNQNINLLTSEWEIITIGSLISEAYIIGDSNDKKDLINPITNFSMNDMEICVRYKYYSDIKTYSLEAMLCNDLN